MFIMQRIYLKDARSKWLNFSPVIYILYTGLAKRYAGFQKTVEGFHKYIIYVNKCSRVCEFFEGMTVFL